MHLDTTLFNTKFSIHPISMDPTSSTYPIIYDFLVNHELAMSKNCIVGHTHAGKQLVRDLYQDLLVSSSYFSVFIN